MTTPSEDQPREMLRPSAFVTFDGAALGVPSSFTDEIVKAAGAAEADDIEGEPFDFERNMIVMRVDPAMLPGYEPTEEERASMEEYRAERAGLQPGYADAIRALDAITEQPARLVLDLHQRVTRTYTVGWKCEGCDAGAYAEDLPEWPCSTVLAVCGHYGLGLDERAQYMLQRPEDGSLDASSAGSAPA